jgi:flagellar motor protein MotB
MSSKIKDSELNSLIKTKIKNLGLVNDIDETKFNQIAQAVKNSLKKIEPITSMNEEVPVENAPQPVSEVPPSAPETINQTVSVSKEAVELARKEGELQQKEREIAEREVSLQAKEQELKQKEEQIAYKPQIPEVLSHVGNAEFIVFNEGELSVGAEGLSHTLLRQKDNPDVKTTIENIWKNEGKKSATIYLVKLEKLGELTFDPFGGTSKFEYKPYEDGQMPPSVPYGGLTPEQAQQSQEAVTPMLDTTEPVTDVTLAPDYMMPPINFDMEKFMQDRIDAMIKNYFVDKYPKI